MDDDNITRKQVDSWLGNLAILVVFGQIIAGFMQWSFVACLVIGTIGGILTFADDRNIATWMKESPIVTKLQLLFGQTAFNAMLYGVGYGIAFLVQKAGETL